MVKGLHEDGFKKSDLPERGVDTIALLQDVETYEIIPPFASVTIKKDPNTLEMFYYVNEPERTTEEEELYDFVRQQLISSFDRGIHEIEEKELERYITTHVDSIIKTHNAKITPHQRDILLYYVKRTYLRYGEIDVLMNDPNIEDISCDGANQPIYVHQHNYGNIQTNILFLDNDELDTFVVNLAQKCGKHISIAEPMLDATMPGGSRIQMTLSTEVTTRGSTFTIRKFRSDPITPTDLIDYHTFSVDMIAYLWIAVEHGLNALISGGTASGKTSTLNAISLFIPRDSKIVSIEETREINIPHPNWIPGVTRNGFGEIVNNRMVGEIEMFDLMKAALRQRPEYILVGEIRGQEAYVLFQAMATGHTTYSTFHADSTQRLIHRLEGEPINIPRIMLQALDIVTLQLNTQIDGKNVRRCKQIVEIIDVDPATKEMLINEVFSWDPATDTFHYSGRSHMLERIRKQYDMSADQLIEELKRRTDVLDYMRTHNIREFSDVATVISKYSEKPDQLMDAIRNDSLVIRREESVEHTTNPHIPPSVTQPTKQKKSGFSLFKRRKKDAS